MRRIDLLALTAGVVLLVGLGLPALARQNQRASRTKTINNLKQIGLGFHSYNDTLNCLPHNGGANTETDLAQVNFGWHNPNVRDSGTWVTQVAPFMELDTFAKNNAIDGSAGTNKIPSWFTKPVNNAFWQVSIKVLHCAERGRVGFSTSVEKGQYPGPVTDFAINVFVNAPPRAYSGNSDGYAMGEMKPGESGDWAAGNSRMTVQGLQDGSSNTILVGMKALPPMKKADAPKNAPEESDCAPVPKGESETPNGDEGIFSPGNWSLKDGKKTLVSTGTGRGHLVVKDPPKAAPKDDPKEGGVPWMYQDSELKDGTPYAHAWGSPFPEGVPFMFGDGTVRFLKFNQKGTVNFARLLYPSDGQVTQFD